MRPGKSNSYLKFKAKTDDVKRRTKSRNLEGLNIALGYLFLLMTALIFAFLISMPPGEIIRDLGLIFIGAGFAVASFLFLRR